MTELESNSAKPDSLLQQAQALHRADRLREAGSLYDAALLADPDDGPTLHMAGMLAIQLSQTAVGLDRLERALGNGFRTARLLDHYGVIKQRQGELNVAIGSFREGLALDPDSGSLWFNLGVAERAAGRLALAITAFGRAAPLLREGFAYHTLGLALQEAGERTAAMAAYRQALAIDPSDAKSALNAGVLAQQGGDPLAAMAWYEQALALDPSLLSARINLAAAWMETGAWQRAATALEAVLADAPDCPQAMNNLGLALRQLGDAAGAERRFRDALARDPFHPAACDNATKLLLDHGRPQAAAGLRRSICHAYPHDPRAWLELARTLSQTGAADQEEQALAQAVRLDPDLAEAQCRLGDCAQRRRDWALAAEHYRRAARLAPNRAEPQTGLALAALKAGDGPAALAACDALLGRNRFDQAAIAYRILALRQCGDSAQADRLSDPDTLVTTIATGMPATALAALAEALKAIRHRAFAPAGQSVRGGTQTENELFAEPTPAIQRFRTRLDGLVGAYLAGRTRDDAHPFHAARPDSLAYHSWSVVLQESGHHVSHIHPGGCLSGVFYVAAPDFQDGDEAGCLDIGNPGFDVPLPAPPLRRLVRPVPGQLVLFPSYLWHGTRPFRGPGERITIAFDVRHGLQPLPSQRW